MRRQPRILPIEMSKPRRPRLKTATCLQGSSTKRDLVQAHCHWSVSAGCRITSCCMSHYFLQHVSLLFRGLQSDNEGIRNKWSDFHPCAMLPSTGGFPRLSNVENARFCVHEANIFQPRSFSPFHKLIFEHIEGYSDLQLLACNNLGLKDTSLETLSRQVSLG